jgi:hypothetical protein
MGAAHHYEGPLNQIVGDGSVTLFGGRSGMRITPA